MDNDVSKTFEALFPELRERFLNNFPHAEDALQEAALQWCIAVEQDKLKSISEDSMCAWIWKAAARGYYRKKKREKNAANTVIDLLMRADQIEKLDFSSIIDYCHTEDKVLLRNAQGYTSREIAEELGVTLCSVEKRLSRSRQRVKKEFRNYLSG